VQFKLAFSSFRGYLPWGIGLETGATQCAEPTYPTVLSIICCKVPAMARGNDFFAVPSNNSGTSVEARYSREYMSLLEKCSMTAKTLGEDDIFISVRSLSLDNQWRPGCLHACALSQRILFQKLDTSDFDEYEAMLGTVLCPAEALHAERDLKARVAAAFDTLLTHELPRKESPTRVLESAFYLLNRGILNVPGRTEINIKQGLAILHAAACIQRMKTKEWIDAKQLSEDMLSPTLKKTWDAPQDFLAVIAGAAGTGKTAVLQVIEKLFEHYVGPDSFLKSAPTNTAARKVGGDTTHALYKLPLHSLRGQRGHLKGPRLAALRRRFKHAIAHSIDEFSMLTPQGNYQVDGRSRTAKDKCDVPYGGLATILTGDFLQLPPVRRPSLASKIDDYGMLLGHDEDGGQKDDGNERVQTEHRGGYNLWRQFSHIVVLTLNMRSSGVLTQIMREMRAGLLTDSTWALLQERVVGVVREGLFGGSVFSNVLLSKGSVFLGGICYAVL
jgi:hypothetical protein